MQTQRTDLRQVQKLRMTPQLVQAVRLMALPLQELKTTIEEELSKNPALQVAEDPTVVSLEDLRLKRASGDDRPDLFEHSSDPGYSREAAEEASEARRQFLEGIPNRPESLQDHLLWQLALQPIPAELHEVAELLVRNLDSNGFHREPPETLPKTDAERALLPKAIDLVRRLDPVGTCAKDVRESLAVQIALDPSAPPRARELVEQHFEALERQRHREIGRAMKIREEELKELIAYLKTLEPMPGRNYSAEEPRYVVPDLMVTLQDGEFMIVLNDEAIPVLEVGQDFERMSREKNVNRATQKFAAESVAGARWFIRTINQRNQTLLKVCKAIVEFQREFFLKGPKELRPLTLKDVAAEVGVHEATVSRITTAKYVQTEWGIFELKHFFSNAVSGMGGAGSRFSKGGVKEVIREILATEDGRRLSDREMVGVLANRGISLARRTVAKYRGELDIDSSYQRRRA